MLINQLKLWFLNFKNARLYRRVDTQLPATMVRLDTKQSTSTQIRDWSPGGVFVETPDSVPLNTLVDLEFFLGDQGGSTLKLRGQVVRQQQDISKGPIGIGIMFTDFTEGGLSVLRNFLNKQSTQ